MSNCITLLAMPSALPNYAGYGSCILLCIKMDDFCSRCHDYQSSNADLSLLSHHAFAY